jgi:hypothetical protein
MSIPLSKWGCFKVGLLFGHTPEFINNAEEYGFALGTLDTDPGVKPQCHVFVSDKAPWYDITDDLPQFAEYKPQSA